MAATPHAALMDRTYRYQRHVYDLTRKYYLFGRDRMIEGLDVPRGGSVLELGCGTGRNLFAVAARWPGAQLTGLDISAEMLATAEASARRRGLDVTFVQGDAGDFDAAAEMPAGGVNGINRHCRPAADDDQAAAGTAPRRDHREPAIDAESLRLAVSAFDAIGGWQDADELGRESSH